MCNGPGVKVCARVVSDGRVLVPLLYKSSFHPNVMLVYASTIAAATIARGGNWEIPLAYSNP